MSSSGGLPALVTKFVGRANEVTKLRRLLATSRLVTLTGPAGVGKTRLAIELARRAPKTSPERVLWVDLGPLSNPDLVSAAVGAAAGITERGGNLFDLLADRLRTAPALILLDNCEHVIEGCAIVVDQLLRACPELRVLATSRELLRIDGELGWSVAPLALPLSHLDLDELTSIEAITLFVDRASLSRPGYRLTSSNASDVESICRRVDGLPLAIELAAARLRVMTEAEVLVGLDDRFDLLVSGARTAPRRQQTLRAALDWSYGLLDADEQSLLRELSVFAGSFSVDIVKTVCATSGDLRRILAALVAKSLVNVEPGPEERMRHRLLDTVRAYAHERLEQVGDLQVARTRHAAYYLALAETSEVEQKSFGHTTASGLLDVEYDNVRAALDWYMEHDREAAARMAGALAWFWGIRGHQMEGRRWIETVLVDLGTEGIPRTKALFGRALLAHHQGDHAVALADLVECENLWRALASDKQLAECLMLLNSTLEALQKPIEADAAVQEAINLFGELGDMWGVAICLNNIGSSSLMRGDVELAQSQLAECLALATDAHDDWLSAAAVLGLGDAHWEAGEQAAARRRWMEGIVIAARLKSPWDLVFGLYGLARSEAQSDPRRALTLAGAGSSLMAGMGGSVDWWTQARLDEALNLARSRLDSLAADEAWSQGHRMDFDRAIAYALSDAPQVGPRGALGPALSRREAQVAELVAQGLTNRGIAERLFISERTVESHLERIRGKLDFQRRSQIASWVATRIANAPVTRQPISQRPR